MTQPVKHTPGPWHVGLKPGPMVYGPQGEQIVGINVMLDCDEVLANAKFIAAAPAMYKTIQHLLEWAKGNRGAKTGNPYCIPEVRHALKTLASIQGVKDYLDADTTVEGGL